MVGTIFAGDLFIVTLGLMSSWMALLWLFQLRSKEADIVDAGWSAGLVLCAALYALLGPGNTERRLILLTLVAFWGIRLSLHILKRALKPGEDTRYADLRASWGKKAQQNFFIFFQLQGALVAFLAISFLTVVYNPEPFVSVWDYLAVAISFISVAGESLADRQLSKFRAKAAGSNLICEDGLWAYSRHPNYFFEWLHWWSYVLLSLSSPLFFLSLIPPIVMIVLMLKVTGIPPIEERALRTKGEKYKDYQRRVSPFIPWFPKK